MNLPDYIKEHTPLACAAKWSVPIRTIRSWARLERHPSAVAARLIIRKTKGIVTWDEIYNIPLNPIYVRPKSPFARMKSYVYINLQRVLQ